MASGSIDKFYDFLEKIGFENIHYPKSGLNTTMSSILCVVITAGIIFLACLYIPGSMVIVAAVTFLVISFMSLRFTHKVFTVFLSIMAAVGFGMGIYGYVSLSEGTVNRQAIVVHQLMNKISATTGTEMDVKTASVKPANSAATTVDVNLRAEPSLQADIVRTIRQGETVTITGEPYDGWLPVEHNGAKGWISGEFVKK